MSAVELNSGRVNAPGQVGAPGQPSFLSNLAVGVDTFAHVASLWALVGGIAYKISPYGRAMPLLGGLIGGRQFLRPFRGHALWGRAAMAWNSFRAVQRLLTSKEENPLQRQQDWFLLASGLFTIGNISAGLSRASLAQRILGQGIAFAQDRLVRLADIQNTTVLANVALDGWTSVLLVKGWLEDRQSNQYSRWEEIFKGGQVFFQVGLTCVFSLDRYSFDSAIRLYQRARSRPVAEIEVIGKAIGRKIAQAKVPDLDRVRSDPYYIATLLVREFDQAMVKRPTDKPFLHDSQLFRAAETHLGCHEGDLVSEKVVKALGDAKIFQRPDGRPYFLDEFKLDDLFVEVLRHSRDPSVPIQEKDVEGAKGMLRSLLFQRFLSEVIYPLAEGVRRGDEYEFDLKLSRSEILEEMKKKLEKAGWSATLKAPPDVEVGKGTEVRPAKIVEFTYEGVPFRIRSAQSAGTNVLQAWMEGRPVEVALRASDTAMDAPERILHRLEDNFEGALSQLADQMVSRMNRDREQVLLEMRHAMQTSGEFSHHHLWKQANGRTEGWYWDPATGKAHLEGMRFAQTGDDSFPQRFHTFDDAYLTLREALERGRIQPAAAEPYTGLTACKGREVVSIQLGASISKEADRTLELNVHEKRVGGYYDEFDQILLQTLSELGATGPHNYRLLAQQLHVPVDDSGIQQTVQTMKEFFRFIHLLLPGTPPKTWRLSQMQMPRKSDLDYGDQPPPPIEQRCREAVREITDGSWDRQVGELERAWQERVIGRIHRLFPKHCGILNPDNAVQSIVERHAKEEIQKILVQAARDSREVRVALGQISRAITPVPTQERPGVELPTRGTETQRLTLLTLEQKIAKVLEIVPDLAQQLNPWIARLGELHSKRRPAQPTLETRFMNTLEKYNDQGELVISPGGTLAQGRVQMALLFGGREGLLDGTGLSGLARERARRYRDWMEEALQRFFDQAPS